MGPPSPPPGDTLDFALPAALIPRPAARRLPRRGHAQGAPVKGQCKTADCKYKGQAAPPCEAAKMTPDVCSAACLEWMGTAAPCTV